MSLSLEIPNRILNSFRHSTIYNYCIGWRHFIPKREILLAVLPCFQVFGGVRIKSCAVVHRCPTYHSLLAFNPQASLLQSRNTILPMS
ncbi:hypothetical protein BS47DRAFT_1337294, partial [Hydnum rufescens UP504]